MSSSESRHGKTVTPSSSEINLIESSPYFPVLDTVRGCAVLLVMLFHCQIIGCGWIGVQIFFVLSGFLITGVLLRDKRRISGESGGLFLFARRFYRRRALRILPLYILYIFLLAIGDWFWEGISIKRAQWIGLATFTYNYSPIWGNYPPSHFYVRASQPDS